ncbi:DUF4129 domain-containing protein [Microbacterium sp. NPDC057659]|uniref:DUF4129 domain-containing protein n=1 Tax=Microbacterium sp. NPDC057659 TaxID=3346198 RepID=UPI0036719DF6
MHRGSRRPEGRTGATRTVIAGALASGLLVVIMLVAGLQGLPRFRAVDFGTGDAVEQTPEPEPTVTDGPIKMPERDDLLGRIIVIILTVIVCLAVLALVVLVIVIVVRRLRELWRDRPLRRRDGTEIDGVPAAGAEAPVAAAAAIRRGIAAAIDVIGESRDPGDAIIAAWVGLEQTAADSGVARAASETPREYTLRIIARRASTERDVSALVDLYERVRYGGHVADDADRRAARDLLERLDEEWR